MGTQVATAELVDVHGEALAAKRAQAIALDEECAELVEEQKAAYAEFLLANPNKRPDASSEPVRIGKLLEKKLGTRDALLKDIKIQEELHQGLTEQRDAEAEAEAQRQLALGVEKAENKASAAWAAFSGFLQSAQTTWETELVPALVKLDALSEGQAPSNPSPADFVMAVKLALGISPDDELARTLPRFTATRLATRGTSSPPIEGASGKPWARTPSEMERGHFG